MMQKSRKVAHCFELFLFFCYLDCNNLIYKLLDDSFRDEESGLRAVCILCLTVTHFPMNYLAVDNPVFKNTQMGVFVSIRLCIFFVFSPSQKTKNNVPRQNHMQGPEGGAAEDRRRQRYPVARA